ncbi:MAG: protein kinase [Pseudomonadota bacterium]|nr:protein kinase [Pseudomonadota bacterium]
MRAGPGPERLYYCPGSTSGGQDTFDSDEGVAAPSGPAVIPRYTLQEELGRGGFSVVYRAFDQELHREVALKLVGHGASFARDARFLREARALAALDEPGVVPVLDAGRSEAGFAWLVMGLVRGPTLDRVIQDGGALPADEAVRIVGIVARTLARLHARGLRHRDVKPSNILMTPDGAPLVSDFGLALDVRESARLTRDGRHPGTPAYMAPELFDAADEPDWVRADVYALGMVLAELLLGERPTGRTGGRTPAGSVWLDRLDGHVPTDLAATCRAAAHPDPRERYPDAAAFADDLERYAARRPVRAHRAGWVHRAGLAMARGGSRGRSARALGIFAVALLLGGAIQALNRRVVTAREAKAAERLVGVQERRARSLAEGRPDEAEAIFQAFAALAEHQGTTALSKAWLDRGRELAAASPDAAAPAFARAFESARSPDGRATAARELEEVLSHAGRWEALRVLSDEVAADPALNTAVRPGLRAELELQELRIEEALAHLGPDDPRRGFLEAARMARRESGPLPSSALPCDTVDLLARTPLGAMVAASTRGYDRSLVWIDPATCARAPLDPGTDALDSWTQALAAADLDGDGRDELVLGLGPPLAYGLRVLAPDASAPVRLALQRLGNVAHVARLRFAGGPDGVAAVTSARHPSRYVFPEGWPAPAVHILRWEGERFREAARIALPVVDGATWDPDRMAVADVDGDGDEDIVVRLSAVVGARGRDATLVLIHHDDGFHPLTLGGFAFTEVDPSSGAAARLRGIIDGVTWTLGVGDGPPPTSARAPIAGLPALRAGDPAWNTAALLARLGFAREAADDLARFGRTLSGDEGARAWAAAATLRRAQADRAGAADAWREAARLGHPGAWALAAEDYDAVLLTAEAASAAREATTEATATATADWLTAVSADVPAQVALGAPLGPSWTLREPFARAALDDALALEAAAGVGPLARLALRRIPGRLAMEVRATVEAQEWGHRIAFRLGPADHAERVVVFVQVSGGGGHLTRDVGFGEQPVVLVPDDDPTSRAHEVRLAVAEARDRAGWLLDVRLDGRHAGSARFPAPPWPDAADWVLEIAAPSRGVDGPYARVRVDGLALGGLAPGGRPAPFGPSDDAEARAVLVSELRRDPTAASARLARERGVGRTVELLDEAFAALVSTAPRDRVRDALGDRLPILDDPRAAASRPLLTAWHGQALLQAGQVEEAAISLARAVDAAGNSGEACVVARVGLALVAGALGADPTAHVQEARACGPHPDVADTWMRRFGFGALLAVGSAEEAL